MRRALGVAAAIVSLGAFGCAPATQNVRAYRAYAHEDVSLKVALDRVQDIARSLELVDRILTQTNYTPGDLWVRRLPMTDADQKARGKRALAIVADYCKAPAFQKK